MDDGPDRGPSLEAKIQEICDRFADVEGRAHWRVQVHTRPIDPPFWLFGSTLSDAMIRDQSDSDALFPDHASDALKYSVNKWIFRLPVSCCVLADADGRQCQCERAVAERAYTRTWKARRQRMKWRVRVWIENRRERLGEIIAGRRFDDLDD